LLPNSAIKPILNVKAFAMRNINAAYAATNPIVDSAIEYANRGWPVFPCNPSTKQPYTTNGFKDATTDIDQIYDWWTLRPKAMIGLPTGPSTGFWALDIDLKPGANGEEELAKLEAANGCLPDTPSVSTPSGGTHYYFKHTAGVKNRGGFEPGIDVRGDGGYVIAPGSVRDDGCYYDWKSGVKELAAAPPWLLALVVRARGEATTGSATSTCYTAYVQKALNNELQALMAKSNNRNNQLNDSAFAVGQFVGAGAVSRNEAETRLYAAAVANGYVGKDGGASARATIRSGLNAGEQEPRKIPERDSGLFSPDPSELIAANDNEETTRLFLPKMHPAPFTSQAAGGLLSEISDWITSTAIIPVPELSLAASIALLAGIFGDRALGPTKSGVNLFMTTVMGVASGKGHAPKSIIRLATLAAKPGAVTNGDPTSYAAIERMLRRNKSTAIIMDEFGITLQDVSSRQKNPAAASIRKFLLAIYDQADSVFHGRQYASEDTKKDNEPIEGPALTVLGMTTGHTLYNGLSEDSLREGFVSRFIFIEGNHPETINPPRLSEAKDIPSGLVDNLRQASMVFPKSEGNLGGAFTKHIVPFDNGEEGDGYKRYAEVFLWEHWRGWTQRQRNVNGRASQNTIRLATIRAIARDQSKPLILAEDVEWGWAIVHQSILVITAGVDRHMSGSIAEALRKAVTEALRNAKNQMLPWSQLLQREGISQAASEKDVSDAVAWLIETGHVENLSGEKKPGARMSFRLKS
jgi:hypothetical protein